MILEGSTDIPDNTLSNLSEEIGRPAKLTIDIGAFRGSACHRTQLTCITISEASRSSATKPSGSSDLSVDLRTRFEAESTTSSNFESGATLTQSDGFTPSTDGLIGGDIDNSRELCLNDGPIPQG